ncbi:unnamed protein product, partial [Dovyalis caffra]
MKEALNHYHVTLVRIYLVDMLGEVVEPPWLDARDRNKNLKILHRLRKKRAI